MGDEKRKKKGNMIIYELRKSLLDTLKYNKHSSSKGTLDIQFKRCTSKYTTSLSVMKKSV